MQQQTASLSEVHRTVSIPLSAKFWKRLIAFAGPAYLVSVGYMDPGNWATDMEGGARFGYQLIWVLLMSNLMAVLLQTLSARLGIVTGLDLAQACREAYPSEIKYVLWILCEIAIAACDLAEVLGTAIGLSLLFGFPLILGVIVTAFDSLLLLGIQRLGMRKMESFIVGLISIIGLCFIIEVFLSKPDWAGVAGGFVPRLNGESLYVAIGIIGATVMPHNLYLHSALVQTRQIPQTQEGKKSACKYNLIDSLVALNGAFFVNAALLVLCASVFFRNGIIVTELQQAHHLLSPLLGTTLGSVLFALALLAAGQSSTLTGTLAGQVVMEGFLRFKMRPVLRRLITRSVAIIPASIVILTMGDRGTYELLILSQVVLSLQLSFAVVPLVQFTSDKVRMGEFVNPLWVQLLAWTATAIIVVLSAFLVMGKISEWIMSSSNPWWLWLTVVPVSIGCGVLLIYVVLFPFIRKRKAVVKPASAESISSTIQFRKIGVAVSLESEDERVLAYAVSLAKKYDGELCLIHVIEGVSGQLYGEHAYDSEARGDMEYLDALVQRMRSVGVSAYGSPGFGNVVKSIVDIAEKERLDILVMGSHGHRGVRDVIFGVTVDPVRHNLSIPVLVVR
jgi:manganese transport protein